MGCVIHWFRRDLRIRDNQALFEASASGHALVPVYILSTWKKHHRWTGYPHQQFLCGCLESLSKNLETIGGRLILREGDQVEELMKLAQETEAEAIYTNRDPDPFGQKQEEKLADACEDQGIKLHTFKDVVLHERDEVLKDDGGPYRVYSPYFRAWSKLDKTGPRGKAKDLGTPDKISSLDLPTPESQWELERPEALREIITPGEAAARKRLKHFLSDVGPHYKDRRNIPHGQTTSRLSQDLRWGTIGIREVYDRSARARDEASGNARKGFNSFISELAWREFYMQILYHFPEVLDRDFNQNYAGVQWDEADDEKLRRWMEGRTGFPMVDAGMRELNATGFMHNRLRMITAMFLTKDLHIHWRVGEAYFARHLTDSEIASNNGGWQWSAGTGADAAPYFRIQNPWTQGERFDPKGKYIRRYLPELADVPDNALHEPPADGKPIADDYPLPMVDHKEEREETMKRFKQGKD